MRIEERIDEQYVVINFFVHQSIVEQRAILHGGKSESEKVFKEKYKIVQELCGKGGIHFAFKDKQKEMIKEWSKCDGRFKDLYAELYPRGGYRGGGRPKGSLSKTKTDKTERVNIAVTPEEKQAVIKFLKEYRRKDVKN
jgi:hypothetical protein